MINRIRELCKNKGISFSRLEQELGFANGSIAKSDERIQSCRLKAISDYFGVTMEYLLTGEEQNEEKMEEMKNPVTADRIRFAMEQKELTSRELANKSGIKEQSISQYVNGRNVPSIASATAMASILDVSPLWLMGFNIGMNGDLEKNLTAEERELVTAYRNLSEDQKSLIRTMLQIKKGESFSSEKAV